VTGRGWLFDRGFFHRCPIGETSRADEVLAHGNRRSGLSPRRRAKEHSCDGLLLGLCGGCED
jgi:hypothetical protein